MEHEGLYPQIGGWSSKKHDIGYFVTQMGGGRQGNLHTWNIISKHGWMNQHTIGNEQQGLYHVAYWQWRCKIYNLDTCGKNPAGCNVLKAMRVFWLADCSKMLLLRIVNAVERVLKLSMLFVQMGYLQSSFCANFVGLGRKCLQDRIWCAMLIYNQYYIVHMLIAAWSLIFVFDMIVLSKEWLPYNCWYCIHACDRRFVHKHVCHPCLSLSPGGLGSRHRHDAPGSG